MQNHFADAKRTVVRLLYKLDKWQNKCGRKRTEDKTLAAGRSPNKDDVETEDTREEAALWEKELKLRRHIAAKTDVKGYTLSTAQNQNHRIRGRENRKASGRHRKTNTSSASDPARFQLTMLMYLCLSCPSVLLLRVRFGLLCLCFLLFVSWNLAGLKAKDAS